MKTTVKCVLSIFVFIGILSCATTSSRFHPSDILVQYSIQFEAPEKLTPDQVSQDIEYLTYILENGYVGHKFRRTLLEERTIPELRKIALSREVMEPFELCRQIQNALDQLKDMHIGVELFQSSNSCKAKKDGKKGDVGRNIALTSKGNDRAILQTMRKKIGNKSIEVIGILDMENTSSARKEWRHLFANLQNILKSDALVIDLRGNGGGDDVPREFIEHLISSDTTLYGRRRWVLQSPEARALKLTQARLGIAFSRRPNYWKQQINEREQNYLEAETGHLERWNVYTEKNITGITSTGYTGELIVLIDGVCASTCENMVYFLKQRPNTVFIGQNTAGAFHFGSIGEAMLINSKIILTAGITYSEMTVPMKDGNFIETIGFKPDIMVRSGEDALNKAFDYFIKHKTN